jgi:Tfp pilus assembly protein PilO
MTSRALLRRVVREHRRVLVPLGVALAVNFVAYVAIVRPLAQNVANIEVREQAAARELAAAQREHAQAAGTLSGKDRAAQELERFYNEVLPRDFVAARGLTYLRLPQLANQFDVLLDRRSIASPDEQRDSVLTRLRSEVELAGRYSDVRSFIYQLESWPEFVVIDNITLSEEDEETGLLELQLDLSTYYKALTPAP